MPRGADSLAAGAFAAGGSSVGALRDAVVVVRRVVVSARVDRPVLGVASAGAEVFVGTLLDERGEADDATVGAPDDRTLGAVVLGAGVIAAEAVVAGHRAP